MMKRTAMVVLLGTLAGCSTEGAPSGGADAAAYFDNAGRDDVLTGGVKLIPVETPAGTLRAWTKRVGNNPTIKVLLLHGGPSATHEYFEAADSYFPGAGVEYYYYDQLGSFYSDALDDPDLWTIEHFVDEVEQVRVALGLDSSNFYLMGHSWGGILAMEYALVHGENLKGLIVSNMMSSIPAYNAYAHDVLMPRLDPAVLSEVQALEAAEDFENPRYMELLVPNWYENHILRMPADQWPDPVNRAFAHLNYPLYLAMQGPSEMGAAGSLVDWDRSQDLKTIDVPTLVIGAEHDTMDPQHMEWMAGQFPRGRYLYCPNGSHMAMYDDQVTYFNGIIDFLKDVDAGM
jgi:proline iminopeptidase